MFAAATWTNTGSTGTARKSHTANLMSNGKVLVTGSESFVLTSELYNSGTGTWANTGSMNTARYKQTSHVVSISGGAERVLIIGGVGMSSRLSSCELYNPVAGTWANAASMAQKRAFHASSILGDGTVFVTGGDISSVGTTTNSAELYDPVGNTWTTKNPLTTARLNHTSTLLNDGRVLITGGSNSGSALSSTEIYTPGSNSWAAGPTMANAHSGHTATLLPNGKVLIAGGTGTSATKAEIFDPSNDTSTPAADMSFGHTNHSATLVTLTDSSQRVLVAGSSTGNAANQASAELYDYNNDSWTTTTSLNFARNTFTLTTLNNGTYLATGGNSASPTGKAAEYYTAP